MEEFDKIIDQATKIYNAPASSYRTNYEHQNALQAQLEKLEEADRKLQPFNGGRSDEVRSNLTAIRQLIMDKVSSGAGGNRKSPSAAVSGRKSPQSAALALPGSEEWLRQLQAEDEVDQEHERRHAKHRSGKNRGSHHKPAGSKRVAHGGGAAAGEIGTQRDAKNAEKQKLGDDLQARLVHLVHPTSEAKLDEKGFVAMQQKEKVQQKPPQHHETHRDCKFGVITQKLLSTGAHVENVEGQPFVEVAFEPQQRVSVPTASLLLASYQEQQVGGGGGGGASLASQVGYIFGSSNINNKSGTSSRRSTPAKKNNKKGGGKSPQGTNLQFPNKKSPQTSPGLGPLKSPNLIVNNDHADEPTFVDCETKVQMYRSVFDVVWALQSANTKGEINLDAETMMDAKSAEILASAIPVPIGGTGAAEASRKLGGVAKVEDYSNNNNNKREPSSNTPQFGSRATTQEFVKFPVSPTPDDSSFPTLGVEKATPLQNLPPSSFSQQQDDEDDENDVDDDEEDFLDDNESTNSREDDDDDDDEYDVHKIAAQLARENRERDGDNNNSNTIDFSTEDEDLFSKAKGIMTQTNELTAQPGTLSLISNISNAPWTIILVQGGYCAAAVFVQGIPIIHKAFHRYVVRKKQGGKQSNQEGIAGSAGSQIRRAQEKKFNEDVQVLLDAWRNLIDASWFIFYSAPSPSNKKLLVTFNDKIVKAAVTEKSTMHELAQGAEEKLVSSSSVFKKSDANASPIRFDDPRVKSVPMTTKRPVFGEVLRVYESLSRCTMRVYYRENKNDDGDGEDEQE